MTVTLSPQIRALIEQKVQSGQYQDADEVVERAVRLLDHHDRRERVIAALAEGEAGEAIEWTPDLADRLSWEAEEMFRRIDAASALAAGKSR